jgi:hypothetical protein
MSGCSEKYVLFSDKAAQVLPEPLVFDLVPTARLELAQLSPLPPQDSVSTNSTTTAFIFAVCELEDSLLQTALDFSSKTPQIRVCQS